MVGNWKTDRGLSRQRFVRSVNDGQRAVARYACSKNISTKAELSENQMNLPHDAAILGIPCCECGFRKRRRVCAGARKACVAQIEAQIACHRNDSAHLIATVENLLWAARNRFRWTRQKVFHSIQGQLRNTRNSSCHKIKRSSERDNLINPRAEAGTYDQTW